MSSKTSKNGHSKCNRLPKALVPVAWVHTLLGQHGHEWGWFCLGPSVRAGRYPQKAVQVLESNADADREQIPPGGAYFSSN